MNGTITSEKSTHALDFERSGENSISELDQERNLTGYVLTQYGSQIRNLEQQAFYAWVGILALLLQWAHYLPNFFIGWLRQISSRCLCERGERGQTCGEICRSTTSRTSFWSF